MNKKATNAQALVMQFVPLLFLFRGNMFLAIEDFRSSSHEQTCQWPKVWGKEAFVALKPTKKFMQQDELLESLANEKWTNTAMLFRKKKVLKGMHDMSNKVMVWKHKEML